MKILKPGKIEMRKFVCSNCECEFVIYKSETIRTMDLEGGYHYWAQCPCRDQIAWDKGEPYEESVQKRTYVGMDQSSERSQNSISTEQSRLSAINGVTFREGQ